MTGSDDRRRTYTWEDPRRLRDAVSRSDGLEIIDAIATGLLPPPPINATLGMNVLEVDADQVVIGLTPREWHYNQTGSVHGSVPAALLDSAMGSAIQARLPAGRSYATIDLSVRYLRPATHASGELRCTGEVVSLGRRVATARGQITDARGRIIATGTTSCLVFASDAQAASEGSA